MKKVLRRITLLLVVLLLAAGCGFGIYVSNYYHADAIAAHDLEKGLADGTLRKEKNYIALETGKDTKDDAGFIFYPGGKVEYTAYLPLMEQLREKGVNCYLVEMPFNLAMFGAERADNVMADNPKIEHWYIGGHSLGGAFASSYASKHQEAIEGVALLGAYLYGDYPEEQSITIYGSEDKVLNLDKITYDTNIHVLEGGNHGQFGNYGQQKGDGKAQISSEEQQKETAELILEFF